MYLKVTQVTATKLLIDHRIKSRASSVNTCFGQMTARAVRETNSSSGQFIWLIPHSGWPLTQHQKIIGLFRCAKQTHEQ